MKRIKEERGRKQSCRREKEERQAGKNTGKRWSGKKDHKEQKEGHQEEERAGSEWEREEGGRP